MICYQQLASRVDLAVHTLWQWSVTFKLRISKSMDILCGVSIHYSSVNVAIDTLLPRTTDCYWSFVLERDLCLISMQCARLSHLASTFQWYFRCEMWALLLFLSSHKALITFSRAMRSLRTFRLSLKANNHRYFGATSHAKMRLKDSLSSVSSVVFVYIPDNVSWYYALNYRSI